MSAASDVNDRLDRIEAKVRLARLALEGIAARLELLDDERGTRRVSTPGDVSAAQQ